MPVIDRCPVHRRTPGHVACMKAVILTDQQRVERVKNGFERIATTPVASAGDSIVEPDTLWRGGQRCWCTTPLRACMSRRGA
ncbi:hypothetical protein COO55_39040 [Rhodococcus opacus]|nr:hypothetical protein COO55_39040 [Rhodococcus opacus]